MYPKVWSTIKEELQFRRIYGLSAAAKTAARTRWSLASSLFTLIVRGRSGGASGLPGDDDVASATEGVRCLQEFEEHALSCSMELVCGILL